MIKLGLLFSILLFINPLYSKTFVINKDHSEINFEVPYLLVSSVSGRFLNFSGRFDLNPKNHEISDVKIIIDPKSVFTANKMRDTHLKKHDFFFIQKYPEITFNSQEVRRQASGVYELKGNIKIRDNEKEIIFVINWSSPIKDSWGKLSHFVRYEFTVNRKDFGLNWNKTLDQGELLLGDKVKVSGVFQVQPEGSKTASSKHMITDNKQLRLREKIRRGEVSKDILKAQTVSPKVREKGEDNSISEPKKVTPKAMKEIPRSQESRPSEILVIASFFVVGLFGLTGATYLAIVFRRSYGDYLQKNEKFKYPFTFFMDLGVFVAYLIQKWQTKREQGEFQIKPLLKV